MARLQTCRKGLYSSMSETKVQAEQIENELKAYYWSKGRYIYCSRLYSLSDLKELAARLGKNLILTEKKLGDT